MRNIINYYYDMNLLYVFKVKDRYYFNVDNDSYIFFAYNRKLEDASSIYDIYLEFKKRKLFINDIILNKDHQIITFINNVPYVLIRDNTKNRNISLNDIMYLQYNTNNIVINKRLNRNNWIELWKIKVDYYESKINEMEYPMFRDSLDYYIGMSENAISYLVNNASLVTETVVSHYRINMKDDSFDFYNPCNFVIDSRVRDISEYIKNQFFYNEISIYQCERCYDYFNLNRGEYIQLVARLLFPTYYFDLFDYVIEKDVDTKIIKKVLDKNKEYILFLKSTFNYILYKKRINIPIIGWILDY